MLNYTQGLYHVTFDLEKQDAAVWTGFFWLTLRYSGVNQSQARIEWK
jgi:hypothetical protein